MKNIVLVGFMGTGKTAVAKALSLELGMKYVSTDELIEKREKRKISAIFADDGEEYFRRVEKEAVKEASASAGQVIDAGGGVVLSEENMRNLRAGGVVVCLWADPETIWKRTASSAHRPLLNVDEPMKRIKELLDYRRPFYEKADFHVDTSGKNVGEIVTLIKGFYKEK